MTEKAAPGDWIDDALMIVEAIPFAAAGTSAAVALTNPVPFTGIAVTSAIVLAAIGGAIHAMRRSRMRERTNSKKDTA